MLDQAAEILNTTTITTANTEQLLPHPALSRHQRGETSPLDELKGLLQAIVEILKHQNAALARLERACATVSPSNK